MLSWVLLDANIKCLICHRKKDTKKSNGHDIYRKHMNIPDFFLRSPKAHV